MQQFLVLTVWFISIITIITIIYVDLKFQYGRIDCPSSPYSEEHLLYPSPNFDYQGM